MPSSGYTAITFVANEQPTTAKWNLIGSNFESLKTGVGFDDNVIDTRHLIDNSVSQPHATDYEAGGATTTSTSYSTLDSATIDTEGGDVFMFWNGEFFPTGGSCSVYLSTRVDGGAIVVDPLTNGNMVTVVEVRQYQVVWLFEGLAAGSHTFDIRWKRNSGSGTVNGRNYSMQLIELKK